MRRLLLLGVFLGVCLGIPCALALSSIGLSEKPLPVPTNTPVPSIYPTEIRIEPRVITTPGPNGVRTFQTLVAAGAQNLELYPKPNEAGTPQFGIRTSR